MHIFYELTDLSKNRSFIQALGFYLAYLFLFALLGALAGTIQGVVIPEASFEAGYMSGVRIGALLSVVVSPLFALLVLYQKKQLNNFGYIILVVVSGILAGFGGFLMGLIPVAFLTTRNSESPLAK